ncbi:hypothetical protein EI77_01515 [Prosthecobacter fusiformis]|uniref:Uncharacterized protein n=1 Tax=Prosthecobacter fusiformis TaxID=48464 RepID=A0A4R7S666_9BACT|nr:hypothetical protein [Prosthecobacter fusiformis]TDU73048.1 hypothetical protein EI77_01515 [Prosthecobacter fusiformis]
MDTNSTKPQWNALLKKAQEAPVPPGVDVRYSVRQRISQPAPPDSPSKVWDELVSMGGSRWMQAALAGLVFSAGWVCWNEFTSLDELALVWSLDATFLNL